MCPYAFYSYKPHYACFNCQKAFKRRLATDFVENTTEFEAKDAKCPDCGGLVANMGLDFEAPKKKDDKAWQHLQTLYSVGITFHSCGCSGAGYVPKNHEDLVAYYQKMLDSYEKELCFWRKREQPTTQSEKDKEYNKYSERINKLYGVERDKLGIYQTRSAIEYWIGLVKEIEGKLKILNQNKSK
jgi:DNA-directed RNA polymerase subunit RPC12/RpoP